MSIQIDDKVIEALKDVTESGTLSDAIKELSDNRETVVSLLYCAETILDAAKRNVEYINKELNNTKSLNIIELGAGLVDDELYQIGTLLNVIQNSLKNFNYIPLLKLNLHLNKCKNGNK
ncbi:MAG: hypothetical protein LBR26_09595 [Prevotella sp.]|jgi:hypothetical protein|nr:hypothetical protein [Prevotella sp.]